MLTPFIRVTHSGSNTTSILLTDVDVGFENQNIKSAAYVPVGGFIDIPYTTKGAWSFYQGDISKFVEQGLVTAQLFNVRNSIETTQRYYQDYPGGDGPGTYAESFPVLLEQGVKGKLSRVTARIDFPAAVGESATIRLFRYRKTSANGSFTYTALTSAYVIDDSFPWSWTEDISDQILDKDLDSTTDSIAVSVVYTNTGGPTIRALRVDFQVNIDEAVSTYTKSVDVATWPPSNDQ